MVLGCMIGVVVKITAENFTSAIMDSDGMQEFRLFDDNSIAPTCTPKIKLGHITSAVANCFY